MRRETERAPRTDRANGKQPRHKNETQEQTLRTDIKNRVLAVKNEAVMPAAIVIFASAKRLNHKLLLQNSILRTGYYR
jgi:hypothetical protein